MFKVLPTTHEQRIQPEVRPSTYERTFEKSLDGDITKLSWVADQEMRCRILTSSNILAHNQYLKTSDRFS